MKTLFGMEDKELSLHFTHKVQHKLPFPSSGFFDDQMNTQEEDLLFRSLFENRAIGIVLLDLNGCLVEVNSTFLNDGRL